MAKSKTSARKTGSRKAAPRKPASAASAAPAIDIGLTASERRRIADGLSHCLADAYTLYLKTHGFHWNITGPMFNTLHLMFETQYTEQWAALDLIAERIRALGFNAPASYEEFARLGTIEAGPGPEDNADWREMVRRLTLGNEAVCRTARQVLKTAEGAGDDPTVDLMTQRLQVHEKNAWMLRSLLM